jgi:hypothetical protein
LRNRKQFQVEQMGKRNTCSRYNTSYCPIRFFNHVRAPRMSCQTNSDVFLLFPAVKTVITDNARDIILR